MVSGRKIRRWWCLQGLEGSEEGQDPFALETLKDEPFDWILDRLLESPGA